MPVCLLALPLTWAELLCQCSLSVEWSHFIASPFRPLRNVKNHFQFLGSMEIHNVIINFPKWVLDQIVLGRLKPFQRKKSPKRPHSFSHQVLNDTAAQPLLWVVGPLRQPPTRRAAPCWQSSSISDTVARLTGASFHPSSLPLIPAFLDQSFACSFLFCFSLGRVC